MSRLTLNGGNQTNAIGLSYNPSGQIASRTTTNDAYAFTQTSIIRDVDLTDWMMDVLQHEKLCSFIRGAESPIFTNRVTGTQWPDVQDQRELYFHPALWALGIRSRDAYQTRHTYATTALIWGVNSAFVARQFCHKNPTMLVKHYGKWIDGADSGAEAAKLNALDKPRKPGAATG